MTCLEVYLSLSLDNDRSNYLEWWTSSSSPSPQTNLGEASSEMWLMTLYNPQTSLLFCFVFVVLLQLTFGVEKPKAFIMMGKLLWAPEKLFWSQLIHTFFKLIHTFFFLKFGTHNFTSVVKMSNRISKIKKKKKIYIYT